MMQKSNLKVYLPYQCTFIARYGCREKKIKYNCFLDFEFDYHWFYAKETAISAQKSMVYL